MASTSAAGLAGCPSSSKPVASVCSTSCTCARSALPLCVNLSMQRCASCWCLECSASSAL